MPRYDIHNLPRAPRLPERFWVVLFSILCTNWLLIFLCFACVFTDVGGSEVLATVFGICAFVTALPLSPLACFFPPLLPLLAIPNSIGWAYYLTVRKRNSEQVG